VNRVLRIVDAASLRLSATLRGPRAQIGLLLADGEHLIVASQDRTLRLFDVARRSQQLELGTGTKPIVAGCLSDTGDILASVALDNSVRLWDLGLGKEVAALWGAAGEAFVAVATRGTAVAVALSDGRVRLWNSEPVSA
jgi:WD40 repeat protein